MSQDPDYEVHPLDRDYSEPTPKPKRLPGLPSSPLHRAGVIIFGIGFFALLFTAGVLGVFRGVGSVETFGSYVHRFAMVMILAGGLLIIVGVRVKSISMSGPKSAAKKLAGGRGLGVLLIVNVAAYVLIQGLIQFLHSTFSRDVSLYTYSMLMTGTTGLMAIIAILHRGIIRGYAVGVVVTMLMGVMAAPSAFGYYTSGSIAAAIAQQLLMVQVVGMICAVYAAFFDRSDTNVPTRQDR